MTQCIIYCNSVDRCDYLYDYMIKEKFPVSKIHSKLSHEEREEAYKQLKNGDIRVLISTDLFSRGIDVQQVSYVINYDIPKNINTYLHRIGRSGRWGRKGVAINFITKYDKQKLNEIEKILPYTNRRTANEFFFIFGFIIFLINIIILYG